MNADDLTRLAERLRNHVESLARTPRPPESAEHRQAAAYIRQHLRKSGFDVEDSPFEEAGFTGTNVLTRPRPNQTGLPLLVIGAHYDSVQNSPGADDNASAVAALLELAAWLGPRTSAGSFASRVQLVAYDLEEYGLVGSFVHSRELRRAGTELLGMISLEMLGYVDTRPGSQLLPPHVAGLYPDTANFIGVVGNEASAELLRVVAAAMRSVPDLPVEHLAVPGRGEVLLEARLSDHSCFWDDGYPALMITDTSFFRNPHYHRPSDTPATLDYLFLAGVTMGVCEAVQRLLQSAMKG